MNRLTLLTAVLALLLTGSAGAAVPDFLAKSPEDGLTGSGAGQLFIPRGVAVNPNLPGDVYVVDGENHRISEFTPWGEFVRAWGWGVKDGNNEFQTCTSEAPGCQLGIKGGGTGQFKDPEAIAVDSAGDVYVIEAENHRVQKFDEDGDFVLMIGSDVNKTREEGGGTEAERNLCTAASGNVCQAGKAGSGLGQFGKGFNSYTSRLATNPLDDSVYVGEGAGIQVFNPNGTFKEVIEGGCLTGKNVRAITTDSAGNLYAAFSGSNEVRKLKGSGPAADCAPTPVFKAESPPEALAAGAEGGLYALVVGTGGEPVRVLEFNAAGACVNCGAAGEGGKSGFDRSSESDLRAIATGSICGPLDIYVSHFRAPAPSESFINIFGEPPNPEVCPPPKRAPQIMTQYALSAEATEATVQALVNPQFWPDTTYHLEYGTAPCSSGGCPNKQPLPPGSTLTTKTTKAPLKTAAIVLAGLEPATTYHYRFVAESGGGGPVFGTGPEPGFEAGGEASFTTFAKPEAQPCPSNEEFRAGASALLPDCRAYELVTPLEKGSGDVVGLPELQTEAPSTLDQSSLEGDKLAYGTYRSFGDAPSAPFTTQYIAARGTEGWASHAISPPRGRLTLHGGQQIDTELKALSPDLCDSWWRTLAEPEPPMDPLAVTHYPNLYLREDTECGGAPDWEALTTVKPPNLPAIEYYNLELQGHSEDGSSTVYIAGDSLEGSGAPPQPTGCTEKAESAFCLLKLYYRAAGEATPTYVCYLPDGTAVTNACSAGTSGDDRGRNRRSNLTGAISADGERVFWSTFSGIPGPGPIYMREHPGAEETGEKDGEGNCVPDPLLACTIAVSAEGEELSGSSTSRFWAADANGERAIFTTGGDLYSFEVGTQTTTKVAGDVFGVAGTSTDASRIYFVSEEACAPGAVAGERNLYLWEAGEECGAEELSFVTALVAADVNSFPNKGASSAVALEPWHRSSRVTPSGLQLAFMSQGSPTGYDNTDQRNGKADAEAYLYDATADGGAGELICASCNPSGARPIGVKLRADLDFWIAAQIPVWESTLYAPRALSEDGKRLYFESPDALTPRDTNGLLDVYQWEAVGSGTCTEASSSFAPNNGGCVDLISSGQGSQAVRFNDASPDGSDVFFSTIESLLGQDYGLVDIYDARAGGGFPEPPPPPPGCEGETCRNPPAAPEHTTPSSLLSNGPGNLEEGKPRARRCAKGKRKVRRDGKARCVRHERNKGKKNKKRKRRASKGSVRP